ncbi:Band 7 protein [Blattella germanica]|nr:Band 7 protein [Blattella germanica]
MWSVCDNCTNGAHKNLHIEPADNFQCLNQLYGELFASALFAVQTIQIAASSGSRTSNRGEFCIDLQNKLEDDNDNFAARPNGYFLLSPQVVQEYERAVIFRLGRLMSGGAKGPVTCRNINPILQQEFSLSCPASMPMLGSISAPEPTMSLPRSKDVRLPVQLQRAMAAEAEAAREARAKVIAAEGEQKASRALREASEVIGDSPAALQLRYLQTLNTISAEKNSTIVFPLPIDLLTYFMKASEAHSK